MKKPLFIILTILSPFLLTAQNNWTTSPSSYRDPYNKPNRTRSNQDSANKDMPVYRHLLKISPLQILNGNIPIFYERKLNRKLSLEVSAGITFEDYIFDATYNDPQFSTQPSSPIRTYEPGYSLSGSLKYYPSNLLQALQGFYFAPLIGYSSYRSQAEIPGSNNSIYGPGYTVPAGQIQESITFTDFSINFGYIMYIENLIPIEFYGGMGARLRNISRAYNVTSTTNNTTGTTTELVPTISDIKPTISFGVKIGLGFL